MVVPSTLPPKTLTKGRYTAYQANSPSDMRAAFALRARAFDVTQPQDCDAFDARSSHVLIKEIASDTVVCCYRLHVLRSGDIDDSYTAQFYDLAALRDYPGLMMELGRFCVHPDWRDPDIVRLAWAVMTDFVDANDICMLFGCSSFAGLDTGAYLDAFALLDARHLAPDRWRPRVKSPDVYAFDVPPKRRLDTRQAMLAMPPLLRTYLLMGGWVSDHAVVDRQMNTLHVFTGLEIGAIPAQRKRLLRALI